MPNPHRIVGNVGLGIGHRVYLTISQVMYSVRQWQSVLQHIISRKVPELNHPRLFTHLELHHSSNPYQLRRVHHTSCQHPSCCWLLYVASGVGGGFIAPFTVKYSILLSPADAVQILSYFIPTPESRGWTQQMTSFLSRVSESLALSYSQKIRRHAETICILKTGILLWPDSWSNLQFFSPVGNPQQQLFNRISVPPQEQWSNPI